MAKDSAKYRSKKERKEQKSSFRDILKTIEDDEEFYEKVAFSKRETLEITSWGMKIQYEQLCKVRKKNWKKSKMWPKSKSKEKREIKVQKEKVDATWKKEKKQFLRPRCKIAVKIFCSNWKTRKIFEIVCQI